MLKRAMDMLIQIAAVLDDAIESGHFRTVLILAITIILSLLLSGWILMLILSRRRENAEYEPVVQHAKRVALFYLDRPLPAEITIEYQSLKTRIAGQKQEYPPCRSRDLEQTVWEAEYNEFVAWELENEIHAMKREFGKSRRLAMRLAMKELSDAKHSLPHGIYVMIKTRFWPASVRRCKLEYAHAWLDAVRNETGAMPSNEKYRALRANKFRCAWCGSDWNDGAHLDIVKTKSGALVPACRNCMSNHRHAQQDQAKITE